MASSPNLPHDLRHLGVVPLRVHRVRDLGGRVAEGQLGGLEPEGPGDLGRTVGVATAEFLACASAK